ncbi:uncharacterized protein LOC127286297 isoform X4 [Leptopilina boulardi]|nr:uncharacterized protein LOC127286297 isoform X4 [Leptopilina boulardi]
MTFTEFKQACKNQNHRLTEARKITNNLRDDFTGNCTDSNHQKKIKDLVNEILPCFDNNSQPNEADLETIYQNITRNLCFHYDIVKQHQANQNCFNGKDKVHKCQLAHYRKNKNISTGKLFLTLGMTHSHQECNFIKIRIECSSSGNVTSCPREFQVKRDNLINNYVSNLKCA